MEDSKDKESEKNIKNLPYLHRFESGRRSEKGELETVLPRLTALDARKSKLMNLRKRGYKYDHTIKMIRKQRYLHQCEHRELLWTEGLRRWKTSAQMTDLPPVPRCNKEKLSSHSAGYSQFFCCIPYPVPLNIPATSKSIKGSSLCLSVCCQCASLNVISSCPPSPSCRASQRA